MVFLGFSLILLFFMQIVSLDSYYERYKTKQIEDVIEEIKNEKEINNSYLEDLAFNYEICISVYQNESENAISTIYNKGCIFSD